MSTAPHESRTEVGPLLSEISREIVRLHARLYGRGPTRAKSYMQNDYLVCIIEDIFTPAERTLVAAGSAEHVRSTRTVFQDAVEPEFVELIERVTGRRVRAFMSQVDTDTDLAIEFFLFEPRPEDDPPTGASPDGNEP